MRLTVFLLLATALKLAAAMFVGGTADVGHRLQEAEAFRSGRDVLDQASTGNSPSFFVLGHYVIAGAVLDAARATGIPFMFWAKVPAIFGDLVIALVLAATVRGRPTAAIAYMLNPVTLLLSVYHGQFHTVAVAGAVGAVSLALSERTVLAAIVLALGASVRQHFAVLLLPLLMRSAPRRVAAALAFMVVGLAVNLPLLTSAHPEHLLSPITAYGIWGYTIPLRHAPKVLELIGVQAWSIVTTANWVLSTFSPLLYAGWSLVFVLWFWRHRETDLWRAALVFLLGFYVVSPRFGVQWLGWALPFWLLVNFRDALVYSALVSALLFGSYWVWTFNAKYGVVSISAELQLLNRTDLSMYFVVGVLGIVTWGYCVWALWRLLRESR